MKTALTIAGSDSSGGAGIQADIKTMTANGVFAMSAVTALTAQNTTGVTDIFETTPKFLSEQLDAVFTDIYPDAVKIGMVSSAELIATISERLRFYKAKHIVVDPVMVATSGAKLLRDDAVAALVVQLLTQAALLFAVDGALAAPNHRRNLHCTDLGLEHCLDPDPVVPCEMLSTHSKNQPFSHLRVFDLSFLPFPAFFLCRTDQLCLPVV